MGRISAAVVVVETLEEEAGTIEVHLDHPWEDRGEDYLDGLMILVRGLMELDRLEGYQGLMEELHNLEDLLYRLDRIYRRECQLQMLLQGRWRVCRLDSWRRFWAV